METNQTAARQARAYLDAHTRTDWSYPSLPPPRDQSDEEISRAVALRERYYGESESSESDVEPTTNTNTNTSRDAERGQGEYKFDSPDAIGDAVAHARATRRRRRRARLEEEMGVNEGLRIWVERRDAWTGARSVRRFAERRHGRVRALACGAQGGGGGGVGFGAMGSGVLRDDATFTTATATADGEADPMDVDQATTTTTADDALPSADTVPVAPPLLPSNPIRASITPKTYPDLYAKIVASSRTPSVPINLSDMTRALVQGWKDANEWPPKIGAVDPLAGRRKGAGATGKALSGLGGVLGGHGHGHGHGGATGDAPAGGGAGFIHRHPHLEKGVGSVRKILHFGGTAAGQQGEGAKEG
ncbi:hypothetical protein B5807_04790 [Epicoccum nigrum]|uniref:Gag1-like clamp domain-containing protein n=1 Tax=Epicoccum nigrum TaxID=105696 RepID=A0A1Y2M1M3_EPING|nr:hypothetical protein B5807_04790 [Epicoccum nigrum]